MGWTGSFAEPIGGLSLATELSLAFTQRRLTPRGLRESRPDRATAAAMAPEVVTPEVLASAP